MPNLMRRTVIVEPADGGWLVMDERGNVVWRRSTNAVLAEVKKQDRQRTRQTPGLDGCITRIEWRNVPNGFVQPQA